MLVPTYKRVAFAARSIAYWNSTGVRTHILDGGVFDKRLSSLALASSNVLYSSNPAPAWDRVRLALAEMTTPYVLVISDDEFALQAGLRRYIETLKNSEAVGVTGKFLDFGHTPKTVFFRKKYEKSIRFQITQSSIDARLEFAASNYYQPLMWSVLRTEEASDIYSSLAAGHFSGPIGELVFCAGVCHMGHFLVLPNLLWLRSTENLPQWDPSDILNPHRLVNEGGYLGKLVNACNGIFEKRATTSALVQFFRYLATEGDTSDFSTRNSVTHRILGQMRKGYQSKIDLTRRLKVRSVLESLLRVSTNQVIFVNKNWSEAKKKTRLSKSFSYCESLDLVTIINYLEPSK